ncbi:SF0329 family protein [Priestia megaterium]|uniref:SF0329 family protein n=1 Tax=Priestia megaterium TaxID=1404 RepID=UPI003B75C38F
MKWTKVKKNIEDLICDKLKDKLSIHLTHYNVNFGEQKRIWVTLDKKEIFNASSAHYVMEHDKLWIEIKRKLINIFQIVYMSVFQNLLGK